jgi:hypothetical protein
MGRTLILAVAMTAAAAAQSQTPAPRTNAGDLRHHIFVLEGALARAVQYGAFLVNREMRGISPEMFSLAGEASARGVYLEEYGVYFDVGVPSLRPSMVWSFRQIQERDDRNTRQLIDDLKGMVGDERVPGKRRALEATIARLEAGLEPTAGGAGSVSPDMLGARVAQPGASVGAQLIVPEPPAAGAPPTPAPTPTPPSAPQQNSRITADRMILKDPIRAYTEAVLRALIDAMIDFSAPIVFGPNEWLTVAARDNAPRDIFAPQDPFDEVATFILRIKGEDLAAYRTGKIDRDEAKKRVQIKEF